MKAAISPKRKEHGAILAARAENVLVEFAACAPEARVAAYLAASRIDAVAYARIVKLLQGDASLWEGDQRVGIAALSALSALTVHDDRGGAPEAEQALSWIGALYDIDDRAGDDPVRRAELRRTESRSVLDELKAWLWDQATLTSLSIGKAAAYTIANWDRLTRFVDDAQVPLDITLRSEPFAVLSSGARITMGRSLVEGPRSRPRCIRSSRR